MEFLKNRMMTLQTTLNGLLVWAHSEGLNIVEILGGLVGFAEGAGVIILGAFNALCLLWQNHLNKES